jgi:hypothetical protein
MKRKSIKTLCIFCWNPGGKVNLKKSLLSIPRQHTSVELRDCFFNVFITHKIYRPTILRDY